MALLIAAAVEDVVEDLEGEADQAAVLADGTGRLGRAREQGAQGARGREEIGRLALAAAQVGLDPDVHVVSLGPLQHLPLAEADGGGAQEVDRGGDARAHQLREGAGQQEVAGRDGDGRPVAMRHGRATAPQLGAVEDVVVDERRHVQQFDRGRPAQHRLARRFAAAGAEERQQRPHALAAGAQRRAAGVAELAGILGGDPGEALLHQVEAAGDAALLGRRGPRQRRPRRASWARLRRPARQPGLRRLVTPAPRRRAGRPRRSPGAGSGRSSARRRP